MLTNKSAFQTEGADQEEWRVHTQGLIDGAKVFFDGQIMYEVACEPGGTCNIDQQSFKAYLARWMAATTKVAPWTSEQILPLLSASATAAAQTCVGGETGTMCGTQWNFQGYDGGLGVGQQMNALEIIQSNLINTVDGPKGNGTGATSQGDPSAGTGSESGPPAVQETITTGDRAGAGILTALVIVGLLGGAWWMYVSPIPCAVECDVLTMYVQGGVNSSPYTKGIFLACIVRCSMTTIAQKDTRSTSAGVQDHEHARAGISLARGARTTGLCRRSVMSFLLLPLAPSPSLSPFHATSPSPWASRQDSAVRGQTKGTRLSRSLLCCPHRGDAWTPHFDRRSESDGGRI